MSQTPQLGGPAAPSAPLTKIEMPSQSSGDDQFGGTRAIHSAYVFSVDKQIGEGTYGQVFMGHDRATGDKVALKKIRMDTEKEGFPITAIREIKILSSLQHQNVVNLREIVRSEIHKNNNYKGSIYMVFDYAEYDLTGLMESQKYVFTEPQVKCILKQLLKGLAYCHTNGVLHRDLKASNILIDSRGTVKLADFGLARPFLSGNEAGFTNRVITLWYRPPELLLGAIKYGAEVDIWSVGCIFAELLTGKPLFPGKEEIDQLDKICNIMGAPTEANWPGVSAYKTYKNMPLDRYPRQHRLRETLRNKVAGGRHQVSEEAIKLLECMLWLDPKKRITASEAVMHPYLWTDPLPCEPGDLPCRGSSHEFTMKKRRNERQEVGTNASAPIQMPPVPGAGPGGYGPGGYGPNDPKRPRYAAPGPGQPPVGYAPGGHARPVQVPQQAYGSNPAAGGYGPGGGQYNRPAGAGGGYGMPGGQGAQGGYGGRPDGGRGPGGYGTGAGGSMGPPGSMGGGGAGAGGGQYGGHHAGPGGQQGAGGAAGGYAPRAGQPGASGGGYRPPGPGHQWQPKR